MNHKILVGLIASLATTGALAQSNVTVYGLFDTTVRYTTKQQVDPNCTGNCAVGNQTAMTEGAFQGPRLGFKGEEDLGGGTAAVFKLESGFQSNNGAFDQQGQLFGRQEFVGLKDKSWGEIDAGRQYGATFDLLGNYDPLGVGNFNENGWEWYIYGGRFDNTLKYTNTWGPVTAELQYSVGGQTGSTSIGATKAGALSYTNGPFSIGGVVQQSSDSLSRKATISGLGTSFIAGPATLYLNYLDAKRDAGFQKGESGTGQPLANTSLMGNTNAMLRRTDGVWTAGVLFQATPALACTVGYMTDSVKNESDSGDGGKISVFYAVADYHLSKRTDVYVDVDRTTLRGGEIGIGGDTNTVMDFVGVPLGGNTSRTGLAAGIRFKF